MLEKDDGKRAIIEAEAILVESQDYREFVIPIDAETARVLHAGIVYFLAPVRRAIPYITDYRDHVLFADNLNRENIPVMLETKLEAIVQSTRHGQETVHIGISRREIEGLAAAMFERNNVLNLPLLRIAEGDRARTIHESRLFLDFIDNFAEAGGTLQRSIRVPFQKAIQLLENL